MEGGTYTISLSYTKDAPGHTHSLGNGIPRVLDEFIVGPENRLAGVAVQSILEGHGERYSPLVFFGPSGSGKTHLAIGLTTAWTNCHRSPAVYCIAMDFARDLADAIETQAVDDFRRRFRRTSLFVLDNLEQLADKPAAQQELIHTLDCLESDGSLVVATALHSPSQTKGLHPSLAGRLVGGLLVPLVWPGVEARLAAVRRLAAIRSIELDDPSARALAEGLQGSVRDLMGALLQLHTTAKTDGAAIDVERVRRYLSERSENRRPPSLHKIAAATARQFSLKVADLRSPCRRRAVVTARGVAMYLARMLTRQSLQEIGRYFGGRDHTTVSYGCSSTEKLLDTEPAIRQVVEQLQEQFRAV